MFFISFSRGLSHGEMSQKWYFRPAGRIYIWLTLFRVQHFGELPCRDTLSGTRVLPVVSLWPQHYRAGFIILRITYSSRFMFPLGSFVDNLLLYTRTSIFTVGQWRVNSWNVVTAWQLYQVEVAQHVLWMDYLELKCTQWQLWPICFYHDLITIAGSDKISPFFANKPLFIQVAIYRFVMPNIIIFDKIKPFCYCKKTGQHKCLTVGQFLWMGISCCVLGIYQELNCCFVPWFVTNGKHKINFHSHRPRYWANIPNQSRKSLKTERCHNAKFVALTTFNFQWMASYLSKSMLIACYCLILFHFITLFMLLHV